VKGVACAVYTRNFFFLSFSLELSFGSGARYQAVSYRSRSDGFVAVKRLPPGKAVLVPFPLSLFPFFSSLAFGARESNAKKGARNWAGLGCGVFPLLLPFPLFSLILASSKALTFSRLNLFFFFFQWDPVSPYFWRPFFFFSFFILTGDHPETLCRGVALLYRIFPFPSPPRIWSDDELMKNQRHRVFGGCVEGFFFFFFFSSLQTSRTRRRHGSENGSQRRFFPPSFFLYRRRAENQAARCRKPTFRSHGKFFLSFFLRAARCGITCAMLLGSILVFFFFFPFGFTPRPEGWSTVGPPLIFFLPFFPPLTGSPDKAMGNLRLRPPSSCRDFFSFFLFFFWPSALNRDIARGRRSCTTLCWLGLRLGFPPPPSPPSPTPIGLLARVDQKFGEDGGPRVVLQVVRSFFFFLFFLLFVISWQGTSGLESLVRVVVRSDRLAGPPPICASPFFFPPLLPSSCVAPSFAYKPGLVRRSFLPCPPRYLKQKRDTDRFLDFAHPFMVSSKTIFFFFFPPSPFFFFLTACPAPLTVLAKSIPPSPSACFL